MEWNWIVIDQVRKKFIVIFGKYFTKNTRWLFEDALILKEQRTVELLDILYEPDRTRDGTEDRLLVDRATDVDIK